MIIKYILKSILGASIIFWLIGGVILNVTDYRFWGYFNALVGGMAIYFLCISFFKREEANTKTSQ